MRKRDLRHTATTLLLALTVIVGADAQAQITVEERVEWLVGNSRDASFAERLEDALESVTTLREMERIADEVVPVITDPSLLARTAGRLGRVALMARRFERAADLFETAFMASGGEDMSSLFAHAQALMQTGAVALAEQRARTVVEQSTDYELKRRAYALVARSLYTQGRGEEAARLLATLAQLDDPALVEPETLLLQSIVFDALDLAPEEPLAQLERLHPDSVANLTTQDGPVRAAPLPSTLSVARTLYAEQTRDDARATDTRTSDATPQVAVTAIQVGSFSDPDNAMHMAEDLNELGVDAESRMVERDGTTLYLVMVGVERGTPQDASRILGLLREAGYDGFLIY